MALPDNLRSGLLPSEAEFLATSATDVGIVPLMRIDRVRVLGGVYGPLRPPQQARVPLWMALSLKKRKRCTIVCPDWLQFESLRELHRTEVMNEAFAPLPLHFMAIAKVLLESAVDDVPRSDEVRALLKSIREARQSKIMEGIKNVNTEHLAINDISAGEITELRPFLGSAFTHLLAMQRTNEADEEQLASQMQQATQLYGPGGHVDASDRTFSWSKGASEQERMRDASSTDSPDDTRKRSGRERVASDDTMREYRRGSTGIDATAMGRGHSTQEESQNNMDLF